MNNFSIGLVGSGRLAKHLCKAIIEKGFQISWIYNRTKKHAKRLASLYNLPYSNKLGSLPFIPDLIIVAISDDAIELFIDELAKITTKQSILVHTSGSVSSQVAEGKFDHYGVLYPLQTFSNHRSVDFANVPICITANSKKALGAIQILAEDLSDQVQIIDDQQRFTLHVAAVFACNFTNHMYRIAEDILAEHQLEFDLIRPLINETSQKILKHLPSESQTGPAIRNDLKTMEQHLSYLASRPEWHEIYTKISKEIMNLRNQS